MGPRKERELLQSVVLDMMKRDAGIVVKVEPDDFCNVFRVRVRSSVTAEKAIPYDALREANVPAAIMEAMLLDLRTELNKEIDRVRALAK
jgi:hypothetical protein